MISLTVRLSGLSTLICLKNKLLKHIHLEKLPSPHPFFHISVNVNSMLPSTQAKNLGAILNSKIIAPTLLTNNFCLSYQNILFPNILLYASTTQVPVTIISHFFAIIFSDVSLLPPLPLLFVHFQPETKSILLK